MYSSLFLTVFAAFIKTACGGISYDDSGEICLAAIGGGVLHPPGYPLFSAVTRLWAVLPLGCVAMRLSLLSSFLSAIAASLILLIWRRLIPFQPWTGWMAAILAAGATCLWSQAGTAKGAVYSLNAVLTLAAIGSLATGGRNGRSELAAGLWMGLGLANHWMSAMGLLPAILIYAVQRRIGMRNVMVGMVLASLGFSLYICLPLQARYRPFLNWGRADNISRLMSVITREQYGTAGADKAPLGERVRQIASSLHRPLPWPVVSAMALAGGAFMFLNRGPFLAALGAFTLVLYGSLLYYGPIRTGAPWYIGIFSIPGALIIYLCAALGLSWLWSRIAKERLSALPAVFLGTLGLLTLNSRWPECDRSREYLAHDLAVNLADSGRGDRLLFANSDVVVFGNWEIWAVRGLNRGLYVVPAPLLPQPWVAVSFSRAVHGLRAPYPAPRTGAESVPALMRAWFEVNRKRFEVYAFKTDASRQAFGGEGLFSNGLAARIGPSKTGHGPRLRCLRLRGLLGGQFEREERLKATFQPIYFGGFLSWANQRMDDDPDDALRLLSLAWPLASSSRDRALVQLAKGSVKVRKGRVGEAIGLYEEACRFDPGLGAAWRNLAVAQLSLGRIREARITYTKFKQAAPDREELVELAGMFPELERGPAVKR